MMNTIITRGLGENSSPVTQGYGGFFDQVKRAVLRLVSRITPQAIWRSVR
jgi:hypothetical protein